MSNPNWNELATPSEKNQYLFSSELYGNSVNEMYKGIILDPKIDNEEVVAAFRQWGEMIPALKMMFVNWLETQPERNDGPITYKEVLTFIRHLSLKQEQMAVQYS